MDLRNLTNRAAERFRSVFSKDNRFFYGQADQHQEDYPAEAQPAPVQGAYPNQFSQPQQAGQQPYMQQAYVQGQPMQYQQPYSQQPYSQQPAYPNPQQMPPQQPQAAAYAQGWQAQPYPEQQYAQPAPQAQHLSPQQSQLGQQQLEQQGRNRRVAQHTQPQPQAQEGNLVPFPGSAPEVETRQMDAYVVNITNITGCRQAMTCLRKGQCTLVVMDQLIDKAEVRRYVDMLNGACFALGGTMTRLSARVGFYILAPSGMMVYTDPVTASANAPAPRPQPGMPQQGYASQQGYPSQQSFQAQQPVMQPQYAQPQMAGYAAPQAGYAAQPQPTQSNPFAPPMGQQSQHYNDQPYAL